MTDAEILERIRGLSALVIGDICLDRWCTYDPAAAEPSRETSIPRTGVVKTEVSAGAGGTVANNLVALGVGRVAVLGAIGEDGFGYELRGALAARGIGSDHLIASASLQTFTYTKLINAQTGEEDRPRVDFINTVPLDAGVERQVLDRILAVFDQFDVILISDQAETARGGVVTEAVRELIAELAPNYRDKVILADSRARMTGFRNVIAKGNQEEGEAASRAICGRVDYPELRRRTGAPLLMVTQGADGVLVVDERGERWVATRRVAHPVDICGAGDSFSAGAAVALAVTRDPARAAEFGNRVASITIMKKGTGTASPEEILAQREPCTLAIDIGGSKFSMAVFDGDRMIARESQTTDAAGGRDWMLARIAAIAREWQPRYRFDRCGVGFGGPVEFDRQQVAKSTHVGGWHDFALTAYLRDLLGVPVLMDNDANAGALGEGAHGAGRGCSPLFYMTLSTGIGGGILADGRVLRGADSWAGELGHINIRPDGPACLCGSNGCYERMCCGLWLERDYGRPAEELLRDPEFVRRYVADLARGLKACIMLLNPARIVIGGGISKAGSALFDPLGEELRRQMPAWSGARVDVRPAALADDSVLFGALELAKLL